jgi:hypothetical protein
LDDHWAAYFWSSSRLTRWPDKTSGDIPDAVMWRRHVENQRMGLTKTSVLMRWCMTKVSALKIMTDIALKAQEDLLCFDVSDEALEVAARAARIGASFTLGSCTGLSECPG